MRHAGPPFRRRNASIESCTRRGDTASRTSG
jgi:hypothetical protein